MEAFNCLCILEEVDLEFCKYVFDKVFLIIYSGVKKIKIVLSEDAGVGSNPIPSIVLFWN